LTFDCDVAAAGFPGREVRHNPENQRLMNHNFAALAMRLMG
jgi:hypothetical protein